MSPHGIAPVDSKRVSSMAAQTTPRMTREFKIIFLTTCMGLYISGGAYFYFEHFIRVATEFGEGQSPHQALILHLHGIIGLLFLGLFGYLYGTHVKPGLRGRARRVSGYAILTAVSILCLTVPGLYYLGDERLRSIFSNVHTYLGLAVFLPFIWHFVGRFEKMRARKTRERAQIELT